MAVTSNVAVGGHWSYFETYTRNFAVYDEEEKYLRCKGGFEL